MLRLQRAAGNRAVADLMAAVPRPVVQRTPLVLSGSTVPGTAEEDVAILKQHLATAPWEHLAKVIRRGLNKDATGLSPWDQQEALAAAQSVSNAREDNLHARCATFEAVRDEIENPDYAQYRSVLCLLGRKSPPKLTDPLPAQHPSSVPEIEQRAKKARVELTVAAAPPGRGLLNMPEEFRRKVVEYTDYRDLANLMVAAKDMWRIIAPRIAEQFGDRSGSDQLYRGVIRCVARYSGERKFAGEPTPPSQPTEQLSDLLREIVKAVGWRDYTSRLRHRRGDTTVITIRQFADEAMKHEALTGALRAQTVYPSISHYDKNPVLKQEFIPLVTQLARHWLDVSGRIPPTPKSSSEGTKVPKHDLDRHSDTVADLIGERRQGGNISVTNEGGALVVYTNRALDYQQQSILAVNNYKLAANSTDKERKQNWGLERGVGRAMYPLPFHSEMQRTDTTAPWHLSYAGNIYHACVQCMASYHALGIPHGAGYRGTHASKVPSVIPPVIRTNSVYLQYYLGGDLWAQVRDVIEAFLTVGPESPREQLDEISAQLTAVFAMLDNVERLNTEFYKKANVPNGPTTTF